jgi:hypothetical protein
MARRQRMAAGCDRGFASLVIASLLASLLMLSTAATAAVMNVVFISPIPDVPVGQTIAATIGIVNANTAPETGVPSFINAIYLTPSCGALDSSKSCIFPGYDPWVFRVSGGTGGGVCAGLTFTPSVDIPQHGSWRFTFSGPVFLSAPGTSCTISFFMTALKAPAKDINGGTAGIQTNVVAMFETFSGGQSMFTKSSAIATVTTGCSLDFDGNGSIDALTDGLLVLRAMFGLTGAAATNGVIGANATRSDWPTAQSNFNTYCGARFNP